MPAGLVFPPRIWRSPVARAAAGALIALAAGTLRHWVFPMTGPRAPFAFFYPAVVMAAVAAGVPAGIAALPHPASVRPRTHVVGPGSLLYGWGGTQRDLASPTFFSDPRTQV